jgi:hypothetical protein
MMRRSATQAPNRRGSITALQYQNTVTVEEQFSRHAESAENKSTLDFISPVQWADVIIIIIIRLQAERRFAYWHFATTTIYNYNLYAKNLILTWAKNDKRGHSL